MNLFSMSAGVLVVGLLAATQGGAAEQVTQRNAAASGGIEEVIVTSQRRAESLQSVPLAVSAFTSDQLRSAGITDTLALGRVTPGLFAENNLALGTANLYGMRGLNSVSTLATFESSVGSYLDNVYIARQSANNFELFDVERIEVARGPQGTLFGRNTTGGAVNVILQKPAAEFGGYSEIGLGSYDRFSVSGGVDLPVSSTLRTKFSGYKSEDDGYVSNVTTGEKLNGNESWGGRAALLWLPTDDFTWDLSLIATRQDRLNIPWSEVNGTPTSHTGMSAHRAAFEGLVTGSKQYIPLQNEVTSLFVISDVNWETKVGNVEFITGYRAMDQDWAMDYFDNPAPTGGFAVVSALENDQFSQEIKLTGELGAFRHTSGVYYFYEDNVSDFADTLTSGTGTFSVLADRLAKNDTRSFAVYSQWDWSITDRWIATVGGRYTDDESNVDYQTNPNALVTRAPFDSDDIAAAGNPLQISSSEFTPRVALQYTVDPALNFYVSATNGFKGGGFDIRAATPELFVAFGPEKVWAYELGMRSQWFDDRLRANVTVYRQDVEDLQLPSAFIASNGSLQQITRNFAGMQSDGIEMEFIAEPIEGLTLFLNSVVQTGEYQDLDDFRVQQAACLDEISEGATRPNCGVGIVTSTGGLAVPTRLPDYKVDLGGSYRMSLRGDLDLVSNVTLNFMDDYETSTANDVIGHGDSYTKLQAGLTLENPNQTWSLAAGCTNCTDEITLAQSLSNRLYWAPPRAWYVNVDYRF